MKEGYSLIFILFSLLFFSQERKVFGYVSDINGQGVSNVSIVFKSNNDSPIFISTNKNGYFEANINKGQNYIIEVYPFNANKITKEINSIFHGELNIKVPLERITNIEEVKIKKLITYKEDTIVYNIPGFSNGTEKKFKDIAKKLPGFEVTNEGVVKVNGELIGTTLVEGQPFFNGNTKLALENIPANALENLEVIRNYNESPINKDSGSNTTALNIKLKEDKKNIYFGDATLGGGIKNYYSHINAYKFKKNNSFSLIGDANNTGEQPFTFNDFLMMKGGAKALLGNPDSFFSESDKKLLELTIPVENFSSYNNHFLTLNLQKSSKKSNWNNLLLFSNTQNKIQIFNQKKSIDNTYDEQTDYESKYDKNLIYTNFQYTYKSSSDLFIKNELSVNLNIDNNNSKEYRTINSENYYLTNAKKKYFFEVSNNFKLDKKINEKLTYNLISKLNWSKNIDDQVYKSEDIFLFEQLLEKENSFYTLNTDYKRQNLETVLSNRINYKINIKNSLKLGLKLLYANTKIFSEANKEKDIYKLFYNNSSLGILKTETTFEYMYKLQKFQYRVGATLSNNYFNYSKNLAIESSKYKNFFILPYLDIKYEWNSLQNIQFIYSTQNSHFGLYNFLNDYVINDFNSVFKGANLLKNNRTTNTALLKYNRYNGLQKLGYNFSISYNKNKGLINTLKTEGTTQYNSVVFYDKPIEKYNFSMGLDKEIFKIKYYGSLNYSRYNSAQSINDLSEIRQINNQINYRIGAMTRWKKPINIDMNNMWIINRYNNESSGHFYFKNIITSLDVDANIFKNFQFITKFKYIEIRKIDDGKEKYIQGSFNLAYSNEKHPFEFSFSLNNIFNTKAIVQNDISESFIIFSKQNILPRTYALKITYTL